MATTTADTGDGLIPSAKWRPQAITYALEGRKDVPPDIITIDYLTLQEHGHKIVSIRNDGIIQDKTVRRRYALIPTGSRGQDYGAIPATVTIEHDLANKRIRLVQQGLQAYPTPWIDLERRRGVHHVIANLDPFRAEQSLFDTFPKYGRKNKRRSIREIPLFITDRDELCCLGIKNDDPIIGFAGDRGGGKCHLEGTMITMSDGDLVPIERLEHDDRDIIALDKELKLVPARKEGFHKRTVNVVLEVKTLTGKCIRLTPEHPLLTVLGWRQAQELSAGSRIATPRLIPTLGEKDMHEHELKILAYLIADGHMMHGTVSFTKKYDGIVIDDFRSAVNTFDASLKCVDAGKGAWRVAKTKGNFNPLKRWLGGIGIYGLRSRDKVIPAQIFKLSKRKMALFLNRLFSCDGSIWKHQDTWHVEYSTTSPIMAQQIQHLLLRFGIVAIRRSRTTYLPDGRPYESERIVMEGAAVMDFCQEIGFFGDKSVRMAQAMLDMPLKKQNTNIDTIPKDLWKRYRPSSWVPIGKALGYTQPKAACHSQYYSPSRQKLMTIAQIDGREDVMRLATSDIFWDEVKEVNVLKGEFTVYDLTIPEKHNFVAADIIVHNSVSQHALIHMVRNQTDVWQCLLNDKLQETFTWTKPTKWDAMRDTLDRHGMRPSGLPMLYFEPSSKSYTPRHGIRPLAWDFRKIIQDHEHYLSGRKAWEIPPKSGGEFRKLLPQLSRCRTLQEIRQAVDDGLNRNVDSRNNKQAKAMADAIMRVIADVITERVTDIDTGIKPYWHVTHPTYRGDQDPFIAAMVLGYIPSLITARVHIKEYFPQIFRYIGESIFAFQEEYVRHGQRIWINCDEITDYGGQGRGKRYTPATATIEKLIAEGRQLRIGFTWATQNPHYLSERIWSNTNYLFITRTKAELAKTYVASYGLHKAYASKAVTLPKRHAILVTHVPDGFILYTKDGARYHADEPLIGTPFPVPSEHKKPGAA